MEHVIIFQHYVLKKMPVILQVVILLQEHALIPIYVMMEITAHWIFVIVMEHVPFHQNVMIQILVLLTYGNSLLLLLLSFTKYIFSSSNGTCNHISPCDDSDPCTNDYCNITSSGGYNCTYVPVNVTQPGIIFFNIIYIYNIFF